MRWSAPRRIAIWSPCQVFRTRPECPRPRKSRLFLCSPTVSNRFFLRSLVRSSGACCIYGCHEPDPDTTITTPNTARAYTFLERSTTRSNDHITYIQLHYIIVESECHVRNMKGIGPCCRYFGCYFFEDV